MGKRLKTDKPTLKLAVSSMILATSLVSCSAGSQAERPALLTAQAEKSLAKGKISKALDRAEKAVLAAPRNADARAVLAQAYVGAGRFQSARQTFQDAYELGDRSARTIISLALTQIADGRESQARNLLLDNRGNIPAGDFGLAIALAGDTRQGVTILSDEVRKGNNTPKIRQNLAFAYALDGRWQAAQLMASQDIDPTQAKQRILQWASLARPGLHAERIASILGVSPVEDSGQPVQLALKDAPVETVTIEKPVENKEDAAAKERLAAAAEKTVQLAATGEIAPLIAAPEGPVRSAPVKSEATKSASAVKTVPVQNFASAAEPAQKTVAVDAKPKTQSAAKKVPAVKKMTVRSAPTISDGSYVVQLGAYSSTAIAEKSWSALTAQFHQLKSFEHASATVVSKGRTLHRLAATGFGNKASADALCQGIKAQGGSCIVRQVGSSPVQFALNSKTKLASR